MGNRYASPPASMERVLEIFKDHVSCPKCAVAYHQSIIKQHILDCKFDAVQQASQSIALAMEDEIIGGH